MTRGEMESGRNDSGANGNVGETTRISPTISQNIKIITFQSIYFQSYINREEILESPPHTPDQALRKSVFITSERNMLNLYKKQFHKKRMMKIAGLLTVWSTLLWSHSIVTTLIAHELHVLQYALDYGVFEMLNVDKMKHWDSSGVTLKICKDSDVCLFFFFVFFFICLLKKCQ